MLGTIRKLHSRMARDALKHSKTRRKPRVPEGLRIYAIGDIHGRADLLAELSASISADLLRNPVRETRFVFLGDYVDRGHASAEVLDVLSRIRSANETVFLRGNHEQILINFLSDSSILAEWRRHGGLETLASYGINVRNYESGRSYVEAQKRLLARMPHSHKEFLSGTLFSCTIGDYFFCHAGARPNVPLARQAPQDLMWISKGFIDSPLNFDKTIVHAHTPVCEPELVDGRINIDTGAYLSGILTCLVLEGDRVRFITTKQAYEVPATEMYS